MCSRESVGGVHVSAYEITFSKSQRPPRYTNALTTEDIPYLYLNSKSFLYQYIVILTGSPEWRPILSSSLASGRCLMR